MKRETEKDDLADRFYEAISDAVMSAIVTTIGADDILSEKVHVSLLRAVGGTMALFALAAEKSGVMTKENAREVVMFGFDSKFVDPAVKS